MEETLWSPVSSDFPILYQTTEMGEVGDSSITYSLRAEETENKEARRKKETKKHSGLASPCPLPHPIQPDMNS